MIRWSIVVSDEIDRALRTFLAQTGGKKGDLSNFIEEAVQNRLFELTVKRIKDRNTDFSQQDIMETIKEACENSRASGS